MMEKIIYNKNIIMVNNSKDTILDILENHGVNVVFQCRSGICGSCRCNLKSGKIFYNINPLGYFSEKEILICLARGINNLILTTVF
jgi:ferredoxin